LKLLVFNVSTGLNPLAFVSATSGSAFYWLGKKANKMARLADIPTV